ncbi:MAG TPA: helix-turn-helix transcriptional regulator [Candidatus Enterenecus stercoripullorum]|nr:helix-turn-helix transcriptional regulator [Candidatus Enterenecus stercoripullorum]
MKKQTFGAMIAALRKERGMTQLELAEQMGVTDKAVSKWERDLSFPDVSSLPRLAEIFEISVDELMQVKAGAQAQDGGEKAGALVDMILKGVAAAMGIAVVVLSFLRQIDTNSALGMLGIGLACLAICQFSKKDA